MTTEASNQLPLNSSTLPLSAGPGLRLRTAREKAHLHITDVASQLHLNLPIVEAIEANDYTKTPNKVFVRGYLKAYAKLVDLPSDEIVAEFDKLGLQDAPAQFATDVLYKKTRSSMDFLTPWIVGLFIIGTLALVFFWWRSAHTSPYVSNNKATLASKASTNPMSSNTNQTDFSPQSTMNSASQALAQQPATTNANTTMTTAEPNQITTVTQPVANANTPATTETASAPNPAIFPIGSNQQPVTNVNPSTENTETATNNLPAANNQNQAIVQVQAAPQASANSINTNTVNSNPVATKPKKKKVTIIPPF